MNSSAPLNTQGNTKAHPAIEGERQANPPLTAAAPITEYDWPTDIADGDDALCKCLFCRQTFRGWHKRTVCHECADDDRDPPFVSKSDEYARKRGYPNIDNLLDDPRRGQGDK